MDGLQVAWGIFLIIAVGALPMGVLRLVALGPGGFERSRTMRISAWFAFGLGLFGLAGLIVTSILIYA